MTEDVEGFPRAEMATSTGSTADSKLVWRETETFLVDQMLGFATSDGVARVTFGDFAYQPGGQAPYVRPVVTLAGSLIAWERLAAQINGMVHSFADIESAGTDE